MGRITYGAVLQNEVKAWPPLVKIGSGFDLVTNNHWWDTVGTPSTEATAVPVSGEAGLQAKFTEVIKCVTDGANEGFHQRYTFASEPRIKSGEHLSALVWVGSTAGGVDCVVKLLNSDASEKLGTKVLTDGDWDLYLVEDHACAGTYVDLQVTKTTSGTFYAVPVTVMIGADAVGLPPRGLVYRNVVQSTIKTLTGIGDEDTWTDIDCTSVSSALAAMANISVFYLDSTNGDLFVLHTRRNGSLESEDEDTVRGKSQVTSQNVANAFSILLDDAQIFEYNLDREGGTGTLEFGIISIMGYWEWE